MSNWPSPSGLNDQLEPNAQQNPSAVATDSYQQPWDTAAAGPQQGTGAPDAYQQPWDQPDPVGATQPWTQPAPQGSSAQPWAQSAPQRSSAQPWAQSAGQGSSAQPWAQSAGPGGLHPGWAAGPSELGLDGSPPPKSRKGLLIAVVVVVLVAALAFVGYRVTSGEGIGGTGASSSLSPGQTVQQYLEALAAGDAEKALSFGASQPASTEFLTNEILAKQIAEMPITNIRILGENGGGELIRTSWVNVAVNFGDVVDDVQLMLRKDNDDVWKLENAAVKLDSSLSGLTNEALDTVTVFGKNLDKGAVYVFPGYLEIGSSNEYLEVTSEPVLLRGLSLGGSYLSPEVALNDAGSDAIEQAVADAFANCQASNKLDPPGCPTKIGAADSYDAVDGTVNWGQADLSGLTTGELREYDMTVRISGQVAMPVSVQTTDGGTKSGTITVYVNAKADITTSPPTLKWL